MVLEAMKMECDVIAPCAGVVSHIHVSERSLVCQGDRVLTLDPSQGSSGPSVVSFEGEF